MRIIGRYLFRSFLTTFVVTVLIVTFVMCLGLLFQITELLARGASARRILEIVSYAVPSAVSFAAPVSLLTTSLILFGKMSADNEIVAMKASGISTWQILSKPLLVAFAIGAACLYVNWDLAPAAHYRQRVAVKALGMESPVELIEEGRFVRDFPGLTVYVGRKERNRVYDILIYDFHGPVRKEIRAKSGVVSFSPSQSQIIIDLFDVYVDPLSDDRPGAGFCKEYPTQIPVDRASLRSVSKRDGDYTSEELLDRIRRTAVYYPELASDALARVRMGLVVQSHKRTALAVSCLTFVLLGVPLGIKANRKESSVGLALSLGLLLTFYVFLLIAESLAKRPELHPYLFLWFPVAFSVGLGWYLVWRSQ